MTTHSAAAVEQCASAQTKFEGLTAWLTQGDTLAATHDAVEEQLRVLGLELMRQLLQEYMDTRSIADRDRVLASLPKAGRITKSNRNLKSVFGTVIITRFAVAPFAGKNRQFVLDQELNLPGQLYSLGVQERVAEVACSLSMEKTVGAISRTTGTHVPKRQVEQLVALTAHDFDAFYAQRFVVANDVHCAQMALVASVDGSGVTVLTTDLRPATLKLAQQAKRTEPRHGDPTVHTQGQVRRHRKRMATVTAVYDQAPCCRTVEDVMGPLNRASTDDVEPVKRLSLLRPSNKVLSASVSREPPRSIRLMFDEVERRDPIRARPWVVLVDGDVRQLATIKAETRRRKVRPTIILDVIHVLSYLWQATKALLGTEVKSVRVAKRVATLLKHLLQGKALAVARQLENECKAKWRPISQRNEVMRSVTYLRNNVSRLRYDQYLAAGYPIATGVIEGACRHLVKDRLAITGARWGLAGADAVLRLRAIKINGHWEQYWAFHRAQHALRIAAKMAA